MSMNYYNISEHDPFIMSIDKRGYINPEYEELGKDYFVLPEDLVYLVSLRDLLNTEVNRRLKQYKSY